MVTGGAGFLGAALCKGLLERGHHLLSFQRHHSPQLQWLGIEQHLGDLADANAVQRAASGCEAIFHNAAKAGAWGSYDSYFQPNVVGTDNVIAACRAHGIGNALKRAANGDHLAHFSNRINIGTFKSALQNAVAPKIRYGFGKARIVKTSAAILLH